MSTVDRDFIANRRRELEILLALGLDYVPPRPRKSRAKPAHLHRKRGPKPQVCQKHGTRLVGTGPAKRWCVDCRIESNEPRKANQ